MSSVAPFVSVVTPVYNGAAFLRQCIESVTAQTYSNWEYVLVDNCSSDATPQIIAEYAAADPRIKAFRNAELLPMLRNHNVALRRISATSDYCQMLHADDWLAPSSLERMVEVAAHHPSVGIIGSLTDWGGRLKAQGLSFGQQYFGGRDIARRTLLGEIYPFMSPSCLLIRSDLVRARGDFYSESALHADVQACYEILAHHDFGFVHETLSHIRVHEASMTSAAAKPMNRLIASNLELLVAYGPGLLSTEEFDQRVADRIAKYYAFLGRSALERRDAEFWRFHRQALAHNGFPLNAGRVLRSAWSELISRPRASIRRLIHGPPRRQRVGEC